MATLGVAIMHAPWSAQRRAWVRDIVRACAPLPVSVVADQRRAGVWPTSRAAWQTLLHQDISHACVLQDDALPVPGFSQYLHELVLAQPKAIVALWHNKWFGQVVQDQGLAWFRSTSCFNAVGLVMPRPWIKDLLAWNLTNVRRDWQRDDNRIQCWAEATNRPYVYCVPSLVAHLGHASSVLHHRDKDDGTPALRVGPRGPVDWLAGVDNPPLDPAYTGSFAARVWPRLRLNTSLVLIGPR